MRTSTANRENRIGLLLLVLYASFVFMFDGDPEKVKWIYIAYALLCAGTLILSQRIRIYRETIFIIAYFAFGFMSLLWAEDWDTAATKVRTISLLIVFLILTTTYLVKIRKPEYLLVSLAIGSLALSFYMFFLYGFSGIYYAVLTGGERIGSLINNVNGIANSVVLGALILIGFSFLARKYYLLIFVVPIGICMLAAGSRTATISLLTGILVIVLLRIGLTGKSRKKFLYFALAVAGIVIVWLIVRNIPAWRNLILRFENTIATLTGKKQVLRENSTKTRMDFIKLGWGQFKKTPIFGNGIGCAGYVMEEKYESVTYLHNNYIEMLASGGIVGFTLYYAPYVILLRSFVKRIFKQRDFDPVVLIAFTMLIARLIQHFGIVLYYSKVEYLFLACLIGVAHTPARKEQVRAIPEK